MPKGSTHPAKLAAPAVGSTPRQYGGDGCRAHACVSTHAHLVDGESIEQAIATRAAQGLLATAAPRAAREMRRIPGLGGIVVAQTLAVVVAEHRCPLATACPIVTGHIVATRERPAVWLRAGENIVHIRGVAPAVDGLPLLGQRRLLV